VFGRESDLSIIRLFEKKNVERSSPKKLQPATPGGRDEERGNSADPKQGIGEGKNADFSVSKPATGRATATERTNIKAVQKGDRTGKKMKGEEQKS